MQFENDAGTSFLFMCADFGEYSLIRAVVDGLWVTWGKLPQWQMCLSQQMSIAAS